MISKSLKFWHNWFQPKEAQPDAPQTDEAVVAERKHPSAITIRTALRQKHKLTKTAAQ